MLTYITPLATGRESNHPNFVGIIPILLENLESPRNLSRDRKDPDFEDILP